MKVKDENPKIGVTVQARIWPDRTMFFRQAVATAQFKDSVESEIEVSLNIGSGDLIVHRHDKSNREWPWMTISPATFVEAYNAAFPVEIIKEDLH